MEGWLPSYNGSLVDEVGEQIEKARERYGQEAADRAVEVASRYAAVDTGALEGLYTTNRGFTRTIANAPPGGKRRWPPIQRLPTISVTRSRGTSSCWTP